MQRVSCSRVAMMALISAVTLAGCSPLAQQRKPLTGPQGSASPEAAPSRPRAVARKAPDALPWVHDIDFRHAIAANHTPLLVASYRATLPDPLWNERYNINLAARYLRGAVLVPGQVFSLDKRIGARTTQRGFRKGPMYSGNSIVPTVGGGICKVASVMYNAAILADLRVVERHPHSMTVPYVPPGQDATISYRTKDLRVANTTPAPLLVWAQGYGGTLYIGLYGRTKAPKVVWRHQVLSRRPTWTVTKLERQLAPGATKVSVEGSEGISVHTWVTVANAAGRARTKDLGVSEYLPCPRVVARGAAVQ